MLGALLAAGGCGLSENREPSMRPAGAGEAGACVECEGEGGAGDGGGGGDRAGSGGGGVVSEQGGAGGEASLAPEPEPRLSIRSITLTQTLEVPLMQGGRSVPGGERAAPIVAGKRALLRVFVDLEEGFSARSMLGVLDLSSPSGDDTLLSEGAIGVSSTQEDLTTTFNFEIEARDLEPSTTYRVRVLEADTSPVARFPETEAAPLVAAGADTLELVLVPMIAGGFAPLMGAAEQAALERRLLALLPVNRVKLTLADAVTLGYPVRADGDGWDEALDSIYELRAAAEPEPHVFYYGMLAPSTSFGAYCNSDCQTGYSVIPEPHEDYYRGSIGVTVFQDGSGAADAWDTLIHELGHALGRSHSTCGVGSDVDDDYPYGAGPTSNLGPTYGWDFDASRLIKPRQFRDVMGYCAPVWVSDYTYQGMFERLQYIAAERFQALAWAPPDLYRVARIGRKGGSGWRSDRPSRRGPGGERRAVPLLDAAGRAVASVEARIVRLDHGPGGYVWLPERELAGGRAVAVDLRGLGGSILPL